MPMPTYVNERPVKTGCWTEREDELLAEWQGKYGNRSALPWFLLTGYISLYKPIAQSIILYNHANGK